MTTAVEKAGMAAANRLRKIGGIAWVPHSDARDPNRIAVNSAALAEQRARSKHDFRPGQAVSVNWFGGVVLRGVVESQRDAPCLGGEVRVVVVVLDGGGSIRAEASRVRPVVSRGTVAGSRGGR